MSRKKNPLGPKRVQYSAAEKRLVVYQHFTLGKCTTNIAIDLKMPLRVVQRVLKMWKEIGAVCKDRSGMGRAPIMSTGEVRYMLSLIERDSTLTLDEIQEQLFEVHDVNVSLQTVWCTLKRLGMSQKKLSKVALEHCAEARRRFTLEIGGEPVECLVCVDESAVNILTTYRENGWAPKGRRARKACHFVRGTRYSILPALTVDGLIYSHVKVGGYNGDQFLDWLPGLLDTMNPYPQPRSVLILDNCGIHHVEGVVEMCEEKGIKLVYLPPYSPDLNPIEECFAWIKAYIRRNGQEFRNIVELGDEAEPYIYLYTALSQVTSSCAKGWFHHSGYL